jgi:hypothetical protein
MEGEILTRMTVMIFKTKGGMHDCMTHAHMAAYRVLRRYRMEKKKNK